ncbi:hypothetical protein D3C78_1653490 [compost metagenome]
MKIGAPGQVGGSFGLVPSGMSRTFSPEGPQVGSLVSTTQWECHRPPSLSFLPSLFSSSCGVSSKSGWEVSARARMPDFPSKPTLPLSRLVGQT